MREDTILPRYNTPSSAVVHALSVKHATAIGDKENTMKGKTAAVGMLEHLAVDSWHGACLLSNATHPCLDTMLQILGVAGNRHVYTTEIAQRAYKQSLCTLTSWLNYGNVLFTMPEYITQMAKAVSELMEIVRSLHGM